MLLLGASPADLNLYENPLILLNWFNENKTT